SRRRARRRPLAQRRGSPLPPPRQSSLTLESFAAFRRRLSWPPPHSGPALSVQALHGPFGASAKRRLEPCGLDSARHLDGSLTNYRRFVKLCRGQVGG